MFLDYFALFMTFFVVVFVFYAIIVIHDIPYEIAHKRNHPHQDAIHVAGWVSLFTLHVLWPFLWIWSTLYREDRGWGFSSGDSSATSTVSDTGELARRVEELTAKVDALQTALKENNKEVGE